MSREAMRAAALIALCVAAAACSAGSAEHDVLPAQASYRYILQSFNSDRPGFGIETNGSGPIDQAMAYGNIAAAAALMDDAPIMRASADWLVAHARQGDRTGWGLGWAWDAFGDGTTNPADTIYGITTAIAAEGLLNAYDASGEQAYLDTVVRALEDYLRCTTLTEAGAFFWYSNQPADARNVHNVSAMLAGMYARAGALLGREDFKDAARRALADLRSHAVLREDDISWRYADMGTLDRAGTRWNDLVHASYIVYGVALAERHLGTQWFERERLSAYLRGYFSEDGLPMEFNRAEARPRAATVRGRAWGVGMMALAFAELGERESAAAALRVIPDYEFAPYQFAYRFGAQRSVPRANSHLLLAAAVAEQRR